MILNLGLIRHAVVVRWSSDSGIVHISARVLARLAERFEIARSITCAAGDAFIEIVG